jgi:hypothetical protein
VLGILSNSVIDTMGRDVDHVSMRAHELIFEEKVKSEFLLLMNKIIITYNFYECENLFILL